MRRKAAILACLVGALSGCTSTDVLEGALEEATPLQRLIVKGSLEAITVANLRSSYLFQSAEIFYPEGIPSDPAELPPMSAEDLARLEKFLARSLATAERRYSSNVAVLSQAIGLADKTRKLNLSIVLADDPEPIAQTFAASEITISSRMVQALYRATLVQALQERLLSEEDRKKLSAVEAERAALHAFEEIRHAMAELNPVSSVRQVQTLVTKTLQARGNTLDRIVIGAFETAAEEFDKLILLAASDSLKETFDDALLFVAWHEVGHVALGHFDNSQLHSTLGTNEEACEKRRKAELDSDKFAVVLGALTTAGGHNPKFRETADDAIVSSDLPTNFAGHEVFFQWVYTIAGLPESQSCQYPALPQRLAHARKLYSMSAEVLVNASIYNGLLHGWFLPSEATEDISRDESEQFETEIANLIKDAKKQGADALLTEADVNGAKGMLRVLFMNKYQP